MDEVDKEPEDWLDFGEDTAGEKKAAVNDVIESSAMSGISDKGRDRLRSLLTEFDDDLRIRLGQGRPADAPPMVIELQDNVKQVRAEQRRYPPAKRDFS